MKNLIGVFLGIALLFSTIALPLDKVYAQYGSTSTQNRAALESQLNVLQKEAVVLLNKKIVLLQIELRTILEQRLKNLQFQLISLLQTKVATLRAELASR